MNCFQIFLLFELHSALEMIIFRYKAKLVTTFQRHSLVFTFSNLLTTHALRWNKHWICIVFACNCKGKDNRWLCIGVDLNNLFSSPMKFQTYHEVLRNHLVTIKNEFKKIPYHFCKHYNETTRKSCLALKILNRIIKSELMFFINTY